MRGHRLCAAEAAQGDSLSSQGGGMSMKPHNLISDLRRIRLENRISQDAIGAALGKSQSQITNYERGYPGCQSPRICTLEAWANTLGYEIVLQAKVKP